MTHRASLLASLTLLVAGFAWGQLHPGQRPAPLPRPMPDAEVLVLGDSAAWRWTYDNPAAFALLGPRAQNLGLPSYRASHLLADAHRLRGSDARVVVHLGAADVSTGAEPEAIADDILHALEAVHEAMPHARILVLELVPRRDQVMGWRTDAVNMWLRDGLDLSVIGDSWSLPYARFVPLDVEPGADGVHLDAQGYAELASVLAPMLVRP